MPADAPKEHVSRYFYIRGVLRANIGDRPGAARDLETSVTVWPSPGNLAFNELQAQYRRMGNQAAANAVGERVKELKSRKNR